MVSTIKNWLGVNIEKIGSGYAKRQVDSRYVVSVIDEQGYAIGRIGNTIQSDSKEIKLMSTTMGAMGKNQYNMEKEIEFYANKLYCVDQRIEVSSFYNLLLFLKNGKHTSYLFCYASKMFSFVGSVTNNIPIIILIFLLLL